MHGSYIILKWNVTPNIIITFDFIMQSTNKDKWITWFYIFNIKIWHIYNWLNLETCKSTLVMFILILYYKIYTLTRVDASLLISLWSFVVSTPWETILMMMEKAIKGSVLCEIYKIGWYASAGFLNTCVWVNVAVIGHL